MRKYLTFAILSIVALTGGTANAQYRGWDNPYAEVQNWGFRMGDNGTMHGLATDCTNHGQGDCAERMARMGRHPGWAITGEGGGWGGGYPPNYGGGYGQGFYQGGGWGGGGGQFHHHQQWGYQYQQSTPRIIGWRVCDPYGHCWIEGAR